jgi:hypothetical protein
MPFISLSLAKKFINFEVLGNLSYFKKRTSVIVSNCLKE